MTSELTTVLVTGANGNLGRLLLRHLCLTPGIGTRVRALVRSERARATVQALGLPSDCCEVQIVDYSNAAAMTAAAKGCRSAVHLVGIIKEAAGASYREAHEESCGTLVQAAQAAGLEELVYLSILGSAPDSDNPCLASKGRAEEILLAGRTGTTVLRVPMVLGPDDYASRALRAQATARITPLVGGGSTWQQPIDAADVIRAIAARIGQCDTRSCALDCAGPEALTHADLVRRAAHLYGRTPHILPIPLALVRTVASLATRLSDTPPITPAMLEVLQHDDRIDASPAFSQLNFRPTPLDQTLASYVGPEASSA